MARTGVVVGVLNVVGIAAAALLAGGCLVVLTTGPWDVFVWFVDLRWPSTEGVGALWGFSGAALGALLAAGVRIIRTASAAETVPLEAPPTLVETRKAS